MSVVTDREVAARLRQAVRDRTIISWIHLPNGDWTINPNTGWCHNKTSVEVRAFCGLLGDQ